MPRTIRYWLGSAVAAVVLAWAAWPGAPGNPATLIGRVDVVAIVLLLTVLPVVVTRRFGPVRAGWAPALLREGGYATVFALILLKGRVEQLEMRPPGTPLGAFPHAGIPLAGLWAGEVVFLLVIGAYIGGLLAVTAERPPAQPATLAIGTGAGVALGIAIYVLRPLINYVHVTNEWLEGLYGTAKIAAVILVLLAAVRAAAAASRRCARREGNLPLTEVRARQGVAAGVCVGVAAALLVSVLGLATIVLLPHAAGRIQWTLPGDVFAPGRGTSMAPGFVSVFERSFSQAAAGYLLVLLVFPLVGAGLGAWGGLFAAGNSGHGGGGGGGGGNGPDPEPAPPGGGRELEAAPDVVTAGLGWDELEEFPELRPDEERVPAGLP